MYAKKGMVWQNCKTKQHFWIGHVTEGYLVITNLYTMKCLNIKIANFLEKYKYDKVFNTLYSKNTKNIYNRSDIYKIHKIIKKNT